MSAGVHALLGVADRRVSGSALGALREDVAPDRGPVLVVGIGRGTLLPDLCASLPHLRLLVLEPERTAWSLAAAGLAALPGEWSRVTLSPEAFFDAELPDELGGAILMDAMGRFDPQERAAVLAELAARLPRGAVALMGLPSPERARRVGAHVFAEMRVGELVYRGITEGWPEDFEVMRWRSTYLCLQGDRVLTESTVEGLSRHPSTAALRSEALAAGFAVEPLPGEAYWILRRR